MTVAIAAMCKSDGWQAIVAAEDHMITAGDVEFEQPQPKIWKQGPYAIAMLYGDTAAQAQVSLATESEVMSEGITDIGEIASRYSDNLMAYVQRSAEAAVLNPLQLTTQKFLSESKAMHPDLVSRLTQQLQDHYINSGMYRTLGGAIITGADTRGCHLYRVEHGGMPTQLDGVGFVAAGSGQWHAESQFMFSRYTREWDLPEALSLVYAAKKRAEVAPGVGKLETDLVVIFSHPPNTVHFTSDSPLVKELENIYSKGREKRDEATDWQHHEVRKFVENIAKPQTAPAAVAPDGAKSDSQK